MGFFAGRNTYPVSGFEDNSQFDIGVELMVGEGPIRNR
jgi:hypothetical protein